MSSQKEMTFFKRVGAYELGSTLGQGSFATVYRGQHRGTKRIVAVKAIVRGRLNQKLTENLEAEISILQTLQHTNVVRLHDVQTTERHVYLVMEFCPGGDLSRFIRSRGAQSEPMARGFLLQLAEGLRYLRSHNLIHRDLKPQNLLLSSLSADATLKIADFGFARYMQQQDLAETLCGSPLYMAPEILRFQKYDAKADLWSVGAIMYELLTARPPFTGANHVQLLKNIESSSAQLPPQLTQQCQRLLSSLLQREPTERLSFEAFFADPFLDLSSPKSRSSSGAAQPTVEHGARLSSDQERGELRGEGAEPRAHATAEAVAAACKASASSATAPPHHPAAAAAPAAAHVPSAAAGTGPAAGASSGGAPPRSPACAASTRAAAAPPVATSAATSAATAHAPPSSRHSHGGCDSRPMASQPFKPMASPPFKPMASPPFKPMASPPLGPQQHAPFVPSMQRAASTPLTPPHKTAAACTAYACAYSAHHASQKAMHHAPQGTAAASGQHPYPNPGLSSGHSLDHATSKESAPPHLGPSLSSGPAAAAPESLVHAPPSAAADAALSRSAGEHSPHSHLTRLPSPRDGPFAGAAYDHLTTPVRKSPSPTAALLASPQQMTRSPPPAPPHFPDGPLPFSHLPPPALPPQVKAPATHLLCSPATATSPSANAITASMLARRQILPVQLPSPATLAHAAFPHAFSPDSDARVLHAPNAHTAPPFQSSVPSGLTIHTTSPMLYDKSLDGIDHEYVLISTPNSPPMMAVPSAAPAAEAPDARDRAEWPGLAHAPDAGEAAQLGAQHAAAAQAAEEQRQLVSRAMAVAELAQDSADGSTAASDESFTPVEALALHVKALDLIQQCLALQSGDCAHGNAHNTTLTLTNTPTPTPATVPNTAPNTAPNTLQTTLQTTLHGSSGPGPALRPSEALLRLDGERCVAASCLSTTDESCSADALRARFAFLLQSAEHIRAQLQHERESSALAKGGQTVCVEEILYRHALIMGREAAVDELLGKLERSCLLYQRAKLLLEQLAHEAEVGQADRAVLSKYAAGFAWRLYEVATKRAHAAQLGDDG